MVDIVPVQREVIENRLLVALNDEDKVALVLTENDLDLVIRALKTNSSYLGPDNRNKTINMVKDLETLKKAAFQ